MCIANTSNSYHCFLIYYTEKSDEFQQCLSNSFLIDRIIIPVQFPIHPQIQPLFSLWIPPLHIRVSAE